MKLSISQDKPGILLEWKDVAPGDVVLLLSSSKTLYIKAVDGAGVNLRSGGTASRDIMQDGYSYIAPNKAELYVEF